MPYAVITGATQGIGKAVAEKFLSQGFSIAFCARNQHDVRMLKNVWNEKYPSASIIAYPADLAVKEETVAFANTVLSGFGTIDVLVNNAGLFFPGLLAKEADDHLEKLMAVNVYSAYYLTRHLLPAMKIQKSGHIFNMCSVASLKAYPNGGAYGISKYALLGFSDNLREELKTDNIKVTAVCPGATYSRSWQASDISPNRMMEATDISDMVWAAYNTSQRAVIEQIIIRPLMGDL